MWKSRRLRTFFSVTVSAKASVLSEGKPNQSAMKEAVKHRVSSSRRICWLRRATCWLSPDGVSRLFIKELWIESITADDALLQWPEFFDWTSSTVPVSYLRLHQLFGGLWSYWVNEMPEQPNHCTELRDFWLESLRFMIEVSRLGPRLPSALSNQV